MLSNIKLEKYKNPIVKYIYIYIKIHYFLVNSLTNSTIKSSNNKSDRSIETSAASSS